MRNVCKTFSPKVCLHTIRFSFFSHQRTNRRLKELMNNYTFKVGLWYAVQIRQRLTLESGIDVGQEITVGPGKFVKKNKRSALNKRRA